MVTGHKVELSLAFYKSFLRILKDSSSPWGHLGNKLGWLVPYLSLLRCGQVNIMIRDLLESAETQEANKSRKSITTTVLNVISQPDVVPAIKSLYCTSMSLLKGPHALQIQCGRHSDRIIQVDAQNLVFAELFPSAEDIHKGPANCSLLSVDRQFLPPFILAGLRATYQSITGGVVQDLQHFEYSGQVEDKNFSFSSWGPLEFSHMFTQHNISTVQLLESFKHLEQIPSEGKSGSSFFSSSDRRFIIKTITHTEWQFLCSIMGAYLKHMNEQKSSLLCKIIGLHSLKTEEAREFFVVMLSVFSSPERSIHMRYDLKGAVDGRLSSRHPDGQPPTLCDPEFNRMLYLGPSRNYVVEQLERDCKFLQWCGIMDYSLLVGVHKINHSEISDLPKQEQQGNSISFYDGGLIARNQDGSLHEKMELYYVGIIDLMQPWTLRKVCEAKIKSVLFSQGQLSSMEPASYSLRFQTFIVSKIV